MESVKILHCADLHLGSKISFLGAAADVLHSEQILCFERIIKLCNQNGTELLIISGDLFDSVNVSESLTKRVSDLLCDLNDTYVAICAGNHDPIMFEGSAIQKLADNRKVFVFSEQSPVFEIKEKNLRVYGSSFEGVYLNSDNPFSKFNVDNSYINIAVLHADLAADKGSNYNPVSVAQIENSGMDYVALGHIHLRTDILKAGNTFYAYSGCVQGTGFDELGQKGVYMGEVCKGRCNLEFVKISGREFLSEKVDVSDCRTNNEITVKIKEHISSNFAGTAKDNLYKITLVGTTDEGFEPDTAYIAASLKDEYFYIKVIDSSVAKIDLAVLAESPSLKGLFVKRMLALLQSESDTELVNLALKIGLKAFDGEVKAIDD